MRSVGEGRSPTFVSVEGLSGVGKTEVATELARSLGAEFLRVTTGFGEAKKLMTTPEHVNSRMCLFVSAMLHSSVRIGEYLGRGVSVVVDGYIDRTLAYHRGMGASISIDVTSAIRRPDYSVLLVCDEDERLRRIRHRARPRTIWDDIELANIDRIRNTYHSLGFPQVDTTRNSVEEVVGQILAICGN